MNRKFNYNYRDARSSAGKVLSLVAFTLRLKDYQEQVHERWVAVRVTEDGVVPSSR